MSIVTSALATLHTGDRLAWLVVPAACAVAAVGLVLALVTIVLLVQRRGPSGSAGHPTRAVTCPAGIPARPSHSRLVVHEGASVGLPIPLAGALTRVVRVKPFADAVVVDEYVSYPYLSVRVDGGLSLWTRPVPMVPG